MLSGKPLQWILRSSKSVRNTLSLLPTTSNNAEQKRSVSWFLGSEEHQNHLSQASHFYSNPEYTQWKEKPFRNGIINNSCFIYLFIIVLCGFVYRING